MGLLLAALLAAAPVDARAGYDAARAELQRRREALAAEWRTPAQRPRVRAEARAAVLGFFDSAGFPAWAGTPWDFYGTSTTPGEGTIACGYFVTTLLEHAGFRVERARLAQQASSYIVDTMARGERVEWLRRLERREVVRRVREHLGDGLYVVGLDLHVGLLRLDGERAAFCHSAVVTPGVVACEDPETSEGFVSQVYVVGPALSDGAIDDWLGARPIATRTPPRGSRLMPVEQR
jgi:hypothetical protein